MPFRAGSSQKTAHQQAARLPYGLSFALDDLVEVKEWAERAKLSLSVVLDHVIEGVEFEEVVIVTSADGRQRLLTLWHTGSAIHAQVPQGRPRAFATMALALDPVRSKRPGRQPWRLFHYQSWGGV